MAQLITTLSFLLVSMSRQRLTKVLHTLVEWQWEQSTEKKASMYSSVLSRVRWEDLQKEVAIGKASGPYVMS